MIDELNIFDYFNAEKIFGYFIKLMITERWFKLIPERGSEVFEELLKKRQSSFQLE